MLMDVVGHHPQVHYYGQLYKEEPSHRARLDGLAGVRLRGNTFDDSLVGRTAFETAERDPAQRSSERNFVEFTQGFYRRATRANRGGWIGGKLHGGTLHEDELAELFLGPTEYRVIVLHRQNLLAAAISWYQARELNQWRRNADQSVTTPALTMDIATLGWFIDNTRRDVRLWQQLCVRHGVRPLVLTYETAAADPFATASQIWRFLDLPVPTDPIRPGTKKLIKSYNHITNIGQIRSELAGPTNGYV